MSIRMAPWCRIVCCLMLGGFVNVAAASGDEYGKWPPLFAESGFPALQTQPDKRLPQEARKPSFGQPLPGSNNAGASLKRYVADVSPVQEQSGRGLTPPQSRSTFRSYRLHF